MIAKLLAGARAASVAGAELSRLIFAVLEDLGGQKLPQNGAELLTFAEQLGEAAAKRAPVSVRVGSVDVLDVRTEKLLGQAAGRIAGAIYLSVTR